MNIVIVTLTRIDADLGTEKNEWKKMRVFNLFHIDIYNEQIWQIKMCYYAVMHPKIATLAILKSILGNKMNYPYNMNKTHNIKIYCYGLCMDEIA